jgi:betaine-aldehyde dehydrogenase
MNTAVPLKSLKAEPLHLPDHRDAFYGGAWHAPKSGRHVDSINPGTGESLGPVADCGADDIDAAVGAAKKAFDGWRNTPPLERARLLKRVANVLRERAEELALIDAADCGNPVSEMVMDATIAAAMIDFYAGFVTEMKGSSIPMGPGVVNFSVREPRGVVGRIIPFNHPFMFCAGKAGAPLATGNTVVMKPPEQAPLSSLRLAELIGEFLPPGVFNVVPGGREAGSALTTHKDVAMIAVMLELGGKNAMIAFPDADPDDVAGGVVGGMNFTWCGQSCGSTSRAFVHEKIYDAVLERVKAKIAHFKPGIATDRSTTMGSIISKSQYERILGFIESGKQEGARLFHGGGKPSDPGLAKGFFIEPTVFADVQPNMRIAREEIFGPVLSIFKWQDEGKMLEQVNSVEYGLTASIWTNDLSTAHRTAAAVQAGFVWINEVSKHFLGAPFGGYKQSGIGREECFEEMLAYTQEKNIHVKLKPAKA